MFFWEQDSGNLPNLFDKECQIIETIQKHIANQFALAEKRGNYNHDSFKVGDRVRVQDPSSRRWSILGEITNKITADDGSFKSYEIRSDPGQELIRNGSHIRHSEREAAVPEQSS